jgi:hypothetical protein
MFLLDSNPNIHSYSGNNSVYSIQQSMANIEKLWTEFIKNAICRYAIVLKETNEFIGWANIKFNVELENDHLNFMK